MSFDWTSEELSDVLQHTLDHFIPQRDSFHWKIVCKKWKSRIVIRKMGFSGYHKAETNIVPSRFDSFLNAVPNARMVRISKVSLNLEYLARLHDALQRLCHRVTKLIFHECLLDLSQIQRICGIIRSLPSLTQVEISQCDLQDEAIAELCSAVAANANIRNLDLKRNHLSAKSYEAIEKLLTSTHRQITTFNNGFAEYVPEAAAILARILRSPSCSMISLKLPFGSPRFRTNAWTIICDGLKANKTLTFLDVTNVIRLSGDVIPLMQFVESSTTLAHLKMGLPHFELEAEGAQAIANALVTNTSLRSLDLFSCSILKTGAAALAEALKVNKTLTSLTLSHNNIRNEGAAAIAESLKCNKTLTYLDISSNCIENFGAIAVGEALKVNTGLRTLKIGKNQFGFKHSAEFIRSLASNSSLTHLDLNGERVSEEALLALLDVLRTNQSLRFVDLRAGAYQFEQSNPPKRPDKAHCCVLVDDHLSARW